jgi:hypothetical protein
MSLRKNPGVSCVRLQNAWISDRTLCYLASGKPAVVQRTGPSRFLPEAAGLFRFRDSAEAIQCLNAASADYERQCGLARALAGEYFDASAVVEHLLERALTGGHETVRHAGAGVFCSSSWSKHQGHRLR